jgi:hypothetical protein
MRVILAARLPVLMSWAAKPAFEGYSGAAAAILSGLNTRAGYGAGRNSMIT